ncbi:MAG: bifunctional phosphopantothenoylcysteine decarboxylase/phosphopantothenate--cysteine ligase CoaBC [Acidobacteria bacterium]|nr:bifunctional phosphopantothenoylcysteine decarboxylase/phosphopantothenate--cysteine ligase CoaBC [Acidobacteriota bacterium]
MSEPNKNYRVGLGVCGGIAAYKAIEVLRLLQKAGCDVRVAMTRHATEFIRPLTFRALTGAYVLVDDYDEGNPDPIAHINFSQNIDLLLIVPATANTLAKFANGIADDFLSSTYLAANAPVMVAPAMNVSMWNHPATRRNIETLKDDGVRFVEPVAGELACKTVGTGKLEDVENIAEQALKVLSLESLVLSQKSKTQDSRLRTHDLKDENILLTVGGTREAIDPVRFISNHSSGKMGFAVAEAAAARGARVTVVRGSTAVEPPAGVEVVEAVSAQQMFEAVIDNLVRASVFIGAAAVADYRPKNVAETKIKKTNLDSLTIELEKTPDILANVAERRHENLLVVGFAAETNDVAAYARAKLERKNLDLIVANDVSRKDIGFGADDNAATLITRTTAVELPRMSKRELADKILDEVLRLRRQQ